MSALDEYGSTYRDPVTGWVGWVVFAAIFMVTIGAVNAIQGHHPAAAVGLDPTSPVTG